MRTNTERWRRVAELSLAVIVIGSIWGVIEMTLGGFLHATHVPQKGAIMGGLAISLMAIFTASTKKPALVPLLGVVAAAFKPIGALILGVPFLSPYVVNPAIAIIAEALAFGVIAVALKAKMEERLLARVSAGVLAGFLGFTLYAGLASILGLGMWPALDFAAKLQTIGTSATPIAIAGAITLVAGYYAARVGAPRLTQLRTSRPRVYYSASSAVVLASWAVLFVI